MAHSSHFGMKTFFGGLDEVSRATAPTGLTSLGAVAPQTAPWLLRGQALPPWARPLPCAQNTTQQRSDHFSTYSYVKDSSAGVYREPEPAIKRGASSLARHRLRLPEPPAIESEAKGRTGRSASPSLRHFQDLVQCCTEDEDESASISDSDWRSQASTAVPLDSVDTIVHSASQLAVEALKVGRISEAQRIMQIADNLYERCGVSDKSISSASSSVSTSQPRRSETPVALRKLAAMAIEDDDVNFAAHAAYSAKRGCKSSHLSAYTAQDARDAPMLSRSQSQPNSRSVLYRQGTTPKLEPLAYPSLGPGDLHEPTPAQQDVPPVVNVYGNAFFGPGQAVAGVGQRPGPATNFSHMHPPGPLAPHQDVPLHTQACMALGFQDLGCIGDSDPRPRTSVVSALREDVTCVTHKSTAASAAVSLPPLLPAADSSLSPVLSDAHWSLEPCKPAQGCGGAPVQSGSRMTAFECASTDAGGAARLLHEKPLETGGGGGGGGLGGRGLCGGTDERRKELSLQSLEDTWGLRTLIAMAAIRRPTGRLSPTQQHVASDEDLDADQDPRTKTQTGGQILVALDADQDPDWGMQESMQEFVRDSLAQHAAMRSRTTCRREKPNNMSPSSAHVRDALAQHAAMRTRTRDATDASLLSLVGGAKASGLDALGPRACIEGPGLGRAAETGLERAHVHAMRDAVPLHPSGVANPERCQNEDSNPRADDGETSTGSRVDVGPLSCARASSRSPSPQAHDCSDLATASSPSLSASLPLSPFHQQCVASYSRSLHRSRAREGSFFPPARRPHLQRGVLAHSCCTGEDEDGSATCCSASHDSLLMTSTSSASHHLLDDGDENFARDTDGSIEEDAASQADDAIPTSPRATSRAPADGNGTAFMVAGGDATVTSTQRPQRVQHSTMQRTIHPRIHPTMQRWPPETDDSVIVTETKPAAVLDTLSARRQRSAAQLQCAVRCHGARRILARAAREHGAARARRRHSAALMIQGALAARRMRQEVRGACARMEERRVVEMEGRAARTVVGFARYVLARKAVRQAERERGLAAFLQGITRVFGDLLATDKGMPAVAMTASPSEAMAAAERCVVIQSQVRGWLARRLVRMTRSAARAEQAAKLLQRQVRGRMARKVVGAVRQACLEEKHVVVVQRAWRVHWARRCVEEMRRLRVEMRAAGLIEAAYVRYASRLKSDKGFAMRRQKSRCLERQERASRCIQRVVRGHGGRKQARSLLRTVECDEVDFLEHKNVVLLQQLCGDEVEQDEVDGMAQMREQILLSIQATLSKARASMELEEASLALELATDSPQDSADKHLNTCSSNADEGSSGARIPADGFHTPTPLIEKYLIPAEGFRSGDAELLEEDLFLASSPTWASSSISTSSFGRNSRMSHTLAPDAHYTSAIESSDTQPVGPEARNLVRHAALMPNATCSTSQGTMRDPALARAGRSPGNQMGVEMRVDSHLMSTRLDSDLVGASPELEAEAIASSARKLQAVWAGHRARTAVRFLLGKLAAVRIQRIWRGHVGRAAWKADLLQVIDAVPAKTECCRDDEQRAAAAAGAAEHRDPEEGGERGGDGGARPQSKMNHMQRLRLRASAGAEAAGMDLPVSAAMGLFPGLCEAAPAAMPWAAALSAQARDAM